MNSLPDKNRMEMDLTSASDVVAKVPKETLKALLYMVAGKPDSNIKLFFDPIRIKPSDILDLNDSIQEKLQNHSIEAGITSVTVNYTQNEVEQYGIWAEFVEHKWNTSKETESITVKWDFLVKLPQFPIPQRHTVVVKVSSRLTPLHLFQAMFSQDSEDSEKLETEVAPVVCRIDFINHILSDELMRIVNEWHKALIKPTFNPKYADFLEKHNTTIARFIHYSLPFFCTAVAAGVLNKFIVANYPATTSINIEIMKNFMYWLLGSGVVIAFVSQVGKWIASEAYEAIENYGKHAVFDFTNGDKNRQSKLEQENKDSISKFLLNFSEATIINIASSVITFFLFQ